MHSRIVGPVSIVASDASLSTEASRSAEDESASAVDASAGVLGAGTGELQATAAIAATMRNAQKTTRRERRTFGVQHAACRLRTRVILASSPRAVRELSAPRDRRFMA